LPRRVEVALGRAFGRIIFRARLFKRAVVEAARTRGIAYGPGEQFFADGRGSECLCLSFTNLTPERIAEGVEGLGAAVRAAMRPRVLPARTRPVAVAQRGGR